MQLRYPNICLLFLILWNMSSPSVLAIDSPHSLKNTPLPSSLLSYQHPPESNFSFQMISTAFSAPPSSKSAFVIQATPSLQTHNEPISKVPRLWLSGGMFVLGTFIALNSFYISVFLGGVFNSFEAGAVIFILSLVGGIVLSLTGIIWGIATLVEPTVTLMEPTMQTFGIQFKGLRF